MTQARKYPRTAHVRLAVLALMVIPLASQADDSDIAWDSQGRAHQHFAAAPGKLVEYCGDLKAGDKVGWHFEVSAPLDFNIHYHVGDAVHFAAKQAGVATAKGELNAPSDQDYCWMWTNKSNAAVSLDVDLVRLK